jgi:hypothetical protein
VAQGLKDKSRVFDTRTGNTRQLERSAITDAYAAAYVTGIVRATTSEILSLLPDDVLVGNTITDGVCTTATDVQVAKAIQGPQCQFFAGLREMITGSKHIIEKKGVSKGMVFMRTRMHASIEPEGKPILAKVNMPMGHLSNEEGDALSDEDKNTTLIETFVAREWDKEWQTRSLKTARKSPCNLTSGNSYGVCAMCPTRGMPPLGLSVILLIHEYDQATMEVTKCGKSTIRRLND